MKGNMDIKIGEEFKPSPKLKGLWYAYLILIVIFGFVSWIAPLAAFAPFIVFVVVATPLILILIFVLYWLPKYYNTIIYKLTDHEMTWRRGVWFKNTGIVPYNRITNIDISQGPLSRRFGIASLKIQTAGYSAPSGRTSEIMLNGIEKFEELRETIMGLIKGKKPVAVETYDGGDVDAKVLGELIKIRKLLGKRR